jgi:hypothetical protein
MCTAMIEDHDRIRKVAGELRTLLVEDGMPIGHWLASSRWSLTRHLLRHLAVEGEMLRRSGHAPGATDPFETRYRRHLADWTPERIDGEWPRYCREMRGILNALERRMDFEEREIYTQRAVALAAA